MEKNGEQGGESSVCNLLDSEMFVLLISEIFFIFQKVLILKVLLMQKMILVLEMFVLLMWEMFVCVGDVCAFNVGHSDCFLSSNEEANSWMEFLVES